MGAPFVVHVLKNFDAQDLLALTAHFADQEGTCLLYSGGSLDSAQNSYLALFPFETLTIKESQVTHEGEKGRQLSVCHPWQVLKAFLRPNDCALDYRFGFLGYELGAFADPDKTLAYQPASTPDAYWQKCGVVIHFNHKTETARLVIAQQALPKSESEQTRWVSLILTGEWKGLSPLKRKRGSFIEAIDFPQRQELYLKKIAAAKEYIRAGEVYQINLSQEFWFKSRQHPFEVFCHLQQSNPAPFSAYFKLKDFTIVSTSPERFLKKEGDVLETRPIKGTMRRGKTAAEDLQLKQQLLQSEKERAELLMITDLMRNDLGKISQIGTVITKEIWRCEAYANVFHLLSIIQAKIKEGLNPVDVIQSCFPGGSITGCPKLRAMEVIAELEQRPRGIYTGSIGYVTGAGDFDLNIAIRTLLIAGDKIQVQLGGGIVIDSDPEQEYLETLVKGASIFNALKSSHEDG